MRTYFQNNKWGIGTAANFQELAEESCGCDLTELFETWVYPH
jgi:aminopeptidase N